MPTPDSRDRRKKRVIVMGGGGNHGHVKTAEERAIDRELAREMSRSGARPLPGSSRALYRVSEQERRKRVSAIKQAVMKTYSNKPDGKCHEDEPCFQGSTKDSRARKNRGRKLRSGEVY